MSSKYVLRKQNELRSSKASSKLKKPKFRVDLERVLASVDSYVLRGNTENAESVIKAFKQRHPECDSTYFTSVQADINRLKKAFDHLENDRDIQHWQKYLDDVIKIAPDCNLICVYEKRFKAELDGIERMKRSLKKDVRTGSFQSFFKKLKILS